MTEEAPADAGQVDTPADEGQAWYESADDEVKGYIQNKGWDDPLKAVASYQELEKFKGANENDLLKIPKAPEAEGAFDEIYAKLGRPESADKYELSLPDGVNVDEARLNAGRDAAFSLGLSQKQFEAMATFDAEYQAKAMEGYYSELAKTQEAEYNALREEWGDKADEREELSRRGLRAVLPQGDREAMAKAIEGAIGTAATLKLFANIADHVSKEDRMPDSGGDRPFGYTKEQALADKKALMDELKGDRERLAAYNTGKGTDFEKMRRINELLS